MQEWMLKAKLHRAIVTRADLSYEGSLTIDGLLMDAVGLRSYERIHIYNINNGERFETYAIRGEESSGVIGLNGAAARKGMVGDLLIIVSYCLIDFSQQVDFCPTIALLDSKNRIKETITH